MDDSNVAQFAILDNQTPTYKPTMTITNYNHSHPVPTHEETTETSGENNKQNVIWTKNATVMLLSLYETKMHMLDNPKKKSKMWTSIAEELRSMSVEVTPDQVRWKINALTKKYKDCIDNGQGTMSFKYFHEMHQILGRYNDESGTYRLASGVIQEHADGDHSSTINKKKISGKSSTPFRRLRTEQRAKIEIDKQWMEYLRKQEEQKQLRDERYERNLRLREEELELRRKELEMKHSLAMRRLELKERKQEEMLKIEREKCALLRKLLADQEMGQT